MTTEPTQLAAAPNAPQPSNGEGNGGGINTPAAATPRQPTDRVKRRFGRLNWGVAALVLLAMILVPLWRGITGHGTAHAALATALPSVAVMKASREDLAREVTIYAEFRPYLQVPLRAKIAGYLQQMNVDFGDRVKKGQLLATLYVPELTNKWQHAIGVRMKAEADYTNVHKIYLRTHNTFLQTTNLVSQQDVDTAEANDLSAAAAVQAAKAEEEEYRTMIDYTQITAPFDGVITARNADPPVMIQTGTASDTQSLPLLEISDNYLLRLDFPVSVAYVRYIHDGDPVEVRVDSLGGKTFSGTIRRSADKVSMDTRTMMTEIEVPNPNLELIPGIYSTVVLKVERHAHALTVPIEAVATGKTPNVYLVNPNGVVEERPVKLGIESRTDFEILAGLSEGDLVMIGGRSIVQPGEKVKPELIPSLTGMAAGSGDMARAKD